MEAIARLRSDIHLVAVDRDLVLLDICADRYICIPNATEAVSVGRAGAVEFQRPGAARQFRAAGYLAEGDSGWPRLADGPPRPARGWDDGRFVPSMAFGDLARLTAAVGDYFLNYRGRSFRSILAYAAKRARADRPPVTAGLREKVGQFHRAAVWMPTPGKCLARSFVLLQYLRRSGLDARWVIAVRTWPFAAHCWLQVDDMVLDDYPERIAAFAPICCI